MSLWTGFSKGNEKVKLGRPNAHRPLHSYFKGQIFEISVQNSILAAQAFGFKGDNNLTKKIRVVSLIQAMPTGPYLYASTKYNHNISNHLEVMKCTRIWLRNSFRGVNLKKEQKYCPSCMRHSYLTQYMSPPNIIILLSYYFKQYGSYSLQPILVSGEIST